MFRRRLPPFLAIILLAILAGCTVLSPQEGNTVTIVADGNTRTVSFTGDPIVSDILRQANIAFNPDTDRVNPPTYSRVTDGMTITVVRVREETLVEQEVVPFQSKTVLSDGLTAGERQLLQPGVSGVAEVTYRVTYEDNVVVSRTEVRRFVLVPPQDEIIMISSEGELQTVTVNGTLVYILDGNAWMMRQNSANRTPLTTDGGLDGRVFQLSEDGSRLLYTRQSAQGSAQGGGEATQAADTTGVQSDQPFNTLWVMFDLSDPAPVRLDLENILFAAWLPGTERTIIYSTAEPRPGWPGWQANNDLWRAQISPTGALVQRRQLLDSSSGGIYGWYGTVFSIAPDGINIAWAQPDAAGELLPVYGEPDQATPTPTPTPSPIGTPEATATPFEVESPPYELPTSYQRLTLARFSPWNAYDFIWVPSPTWSPDSELFAVATHGPPLGTENPEDSRVFNLSVFPHGGGFSVDLVQQVGMWAEPSYSPAVAPDGTALHVSLAYFQALQPLDSVYSRYQLIITDRDGSNSRALYPAEDQQGVNPQTIAWSPDGQQIAIVNPGPTGNLYLVDTATGLTEQLTAGGNASSPRWAP